MFMDSVYEAFFDELSRIEMHKLAGLKLPNRLLPPPRLSVQQSQIARTLPENVATRVVRYEAPTQIMGAPTRIVEAPTQIMGAPTRIVEAPARAPRAASYSNGSATPVAPTAEAERRMAEMRAGFTHSSPREPAPPRALPDSTVARRLQERFGNTQVSAPPAFEPPPRRVVPPPIPREALGKPKLPRLGSRSENAAVQGNMSLSNGFSRVPATNTGLTRPMEQRAVSEWNPARLDVGSGAAQVTRRPVMYQPYESTSAIARARAGVA